MTFPQSFSANTSLRALHKETKNAQTNERLIPSPLSVMANGGLTAHGPLALQVLDYLRLRICNHRKSGGS